MADPTREPFVPLEWQIAPYRDITSPIILLTGGAGGGKSRVAAEKIVACCYHFPNVTCLVMRKAREWNSRSTIPFLSQTVIGNARGVRFYVSSGTFVFDNGSTIYTGGMMDEEQRQAVRSIGGEGGLDICWMEEGTAFTREDFDEVRARLRHNAMGWRQIIITTNPAGPTHWIYRDLVKGGGATVYYSFASDNPYNPVDYLESLKNLSGVMRARMLEGKWIHAEGAIYDEFDHSIHVKERAASEFKYWYVGCDEGYRNPACLLLVGEDSAGRLHVFRELYSPGLLHLDLVARLVEWNQTCRIQAIFVDPSATTLISTCRAAGLPAYPANRQIGVVSGIRLVKEFLLVDESGQPGLTISPAATNTIQEMELYMWREGKDEPMKENDHAMDALRYVVSSLTKMPSGRGT